MQHYRVDVFVIVNLTLKLEYVCSIYIPPVFCNWTFSEVAHQVLIFVIYWWWLIFIRFYYKPLLTISLSIWLFWEDIFLGVAFRDELYAFISIFVFYYFRRGNEIIYFHQILMNACTKVKQTYVPVGSHHCFNKPSSFSSDWLTCLLISSGYFQVWRTRKIP